MVWNLWILRQRGLIRKNWIRIIAHHFLKMNKKMADIDIDPFGEHESRPEEPTDEHIPLDLVTPVGGGGST